MDGFSLAPRVVLVSSPNGLLETQILPAPTKCPNVTHSLQYFHDTRVSKQWLLELKVKKKVGLGFLKVQSLGGTTAEKGKKYSITVRVCKTENSFTMRLLSPLYGFLSSLKKKRELHLKKEITEEKNRKTMINTWERDSAELQPEKGSAPLPCPSHQHFLGSDNEDSGSCQTVNKQHSWGNLKGVQVPGTFPGQRERKTIKNHQFYTQWLDLSSGPKGKEVTPSYRDIRFKYIFRSSGSAISQHGFLSFFNTFFLISKRER